MCGYKIFHNEFLRCSTKNKTLFKCHHTYKAHTNLCTK